MGVTECAWLSEGRAFSLLTSTLTSCPSPAESSQNLNCLKSPNPVVSDAQKLLSVPTLASGSLVHMQAHLQCGHEKVWWRKKQSREIS